MHDCCGLVKHRQHSQLRSLWSCNNKRELINRAIKNNCKKQCQKKIPSPSTFAARQNLKKNKSDCTKHKNMNKSWNRTHYSSYKTHGPIKIRNSLFLKLFAEFCSKTFNTKFCKKTCAKCGCNKDK